MAESTPAKVRYSTFLFCPVAIKMSSISGPETLTRAQPIGLHRFEKYHGNLAT